MIKGFAHIALYTTKFKETINFYKEIFDAKEMGYFKTKTDACWLSVGDDILEIFNEVLEFSKYIVPASSASQKIASDKISERPELKEKIILDHGVDDFVKKGTLGATFDEVQEGINQALNLDCNMIIAIGEAATKFKKCVNNL